MTRLIDAGRKMQQVEAWIALQWWRNQQAIGAAIDIFETTAILDRAAKRGQAEIIELHNDEAFGIAGNRQTFAKRQCEIAQGFDGWLSPSASMEASPCQTNPNAVPGGESKVVLHP